MKIIHNAIKEPILDYVHNNVHNLCCLLLHVNVYEFTSNWKTLVGDITSYPGCCVWHNLSHGSWFSWVPWKVGLLESGLICNDKFLTKLFPEPYHGGGIFFSDGPDFQTNLSDTFTVIRKFTQGTVRRIWILVLELEGIGLTIYCDLFSFQVPFGGSMYRFGNKQAGTNNN